MISLSINLIFVIKGLAFLRDPSLGGLDGEEGEHGHKAVVIVERLPLPESGNHTWRFPVALVVEIISSGERKRKGKKEMRKKEITTCWNLDHLVRQFVQQTPSSTLQKNKEKDRSLKF